MKRALAVAATVAAITLSVVGSGAATPDPASLPPPVGSVMTWYSVGQETSVTTPSGWLGWAWWESTRPVQWKGGWL